MIFGGSVITERLYIDVKQDLKKKKKKKPSIRKAACDPRAVPPCAGSRNEVGVGQSIKALQNHSLNAATGQNSKASQN